MSHSSTLHVSTPDGADHINLGNIASSSTDITSLQLLVNNTANESQSCTLSLSPEISSFLTIHSVHTSSSTPTHVPPLHLHHATDMSNVNLLHSEWQPPCHIVVPPSASLSVTLCLKPVSSSPDRQHAAYDPASSSLTKPLNGRLLFLIASSRQLAACVHVSARLAESWLKPDNGFFDFGRCAIGLWSYAELTVHNLNNLPTAFSLSADFPTETPDSDRTNLCFLDLHTRQSLDATCVHVQPHSSTCITVGIRAVSVGSKQRWFSIQNVRNVLDVWYIHVTANATSEHVAEKMTVSCGSVIDFTDCYAHFRTSSDIAVQNNYSDAITVEMSSDRKQHIKYEVLDEGGHDDLKSTRPSESLDRLSYKDFPAPALSLPDPVRTDAQSADPSSSRNSETSFGNPSRAQSAVPDDYFPLRYSANAEPLEKTDEMTSATKTRLAEKMKLWSGQTKNIRVWYFPLGRSWDRGSGRNVSPEDPGQLHPQRFQLVFKLPTEEARTITARARVCESVIRLERSEVHLGDCDVFVTYKTAVTVINCSDLPAFVKVSHVSQCVFASTLDFEIKPRDTFELQFDFIPRQVNSSYHKEITLTNLRNPRAQDLEFTLRANCIDRQGVSLHALFYKLLAPSPTNEIDFGVTVANHAAIRAFRVQNETDKRLVLKLEGSLGVRTFVPASALARSTWVSQRILGRRGVREMTSDMKQVYPRYDYIGGDGDLVGIEHNFRTAVCLLDPGAGLEYLPSNCVASHDQIDVQERACSWGHDLEVMESGRAGLESEGFVEGSEDGLTGQIRPMKGEENWSSLLRCVEENEFGSLACMPTVSSNFDAEVRYMERQFEPMDRLRRAVRDGYLTETDTVCVSPGVEAVVVVSLVLTDSEVRGKGKLRGFEKQVVVRMLEYDESRLADAAANGLKMGVDELVQMAKCRTPREVGLTVRACKSQMSVAPLRQLNFGTIHVGEQKDKAFTIVNLSEAPLLYEIGKDDDGDDGLNQLRLNVGGGNRGVVRPYFTKLVSFIYAPYVEGCFEQRFVVTNLMDQSANCEVVVKAVVRA